MIEVIRKSTGGGAQGPKGDPGAAGAPGPGVFLVGEEGEEGPIGPPGLTGPQGAAGSAGPVGSPGEDGADGEQIIVMGAPSFPFPPNAYGTDVPIVYDDEGTFAVNNTGYLGQRSRLTLTTSEHAVFAGTGRVDL